MKDIARRGMPITGAVRAPAAGGPVIRWGRIAWALLGIVGVVVVAWIAVTGLAVVVVPLVVALFPAALLAPLVGRLHRWGLPRPLAVLIASVLAAAALGGVVALIVPPVVSQLPELAGSLRGAGDRLNTLIDQVPGVQAGTTVSDLLQQGASAAMGGISTAVVTGLNLVVGLLLVVVVVVCYLTGGRRIVGTAIGMLPVPRRASARELLVRIWMTLGSYTRALFLVALFDATSIGLGLWLLGVPLVVPLAVLVFFGALIPYIGATLSGLVAVLVAFSAGGLGSALAVLALILVVQQVEGNVVQPLLMGRVTRLSAFTVIIAVSAGATVLGVLGAFLAVPVAACTARAVAFARERDRLPPAVVPETAS